MIKRTDKDKNVTDKKYKVSVIVITYNQEKYIGHTLESIVSQKTNFDYEILVGEDKSPDSTAKIVREYAQKYPDRIVPYIREKNYGMVNNFVDLLSRAQGEYYAFLEGDDYWIDENKLQKQVDFMDAHPEYAACFGKIIIVDQDDKRNEEMEKYSSYWQGNGDYTIKDLEYNYKLPGQTGSAVYRKGMLDRAHEMALKAGFEENRFCDIYMVIMALSQGKIYCLDDVISAYRYIVAPDSGTWSSENDSYSFKNLMKYLDGLNHMEKVASDLGISLNYDGRRKYEWDKLISSKGEFSKENEKIIKRTLIDNSNNKISMRLHGIRRLIKKR